MALTMWFWVVGVKYTVMYVYKLKSQLTRLLNVLIGFFWLKEVLGHIYEWQNTWPSGHLHFSKSHMSWSLIAKGGVIWLDVVGYFSPVLRVKTITAYWFLFVAQILCGPFLVACSSQVRYHKEGKRTINLSFFLPTWLNYGSEVVYYYPFQYRIKSTFGSHSEQLAILYCSMENF